MESGQSVLEMPVRILEALGAEPAGNGVGASQQSLRRKLSASHTCLGGDAVQEASRFHRECCPGSHCWSQVGHGYLTGGVQRSLAQLSPTPVGKVDVQVRRDGGQLDGLLVALLEELGRSVAPC